MKALVIGGGIIGSSVAWRLAREGAESHDSRARAPGSGGLVGGRRRRSRRPSAGTGPFFDLCVRAREVFAAAVADAPGRVRHRSRVRRRWHPLCRLRRGRKHGATGPRAMAKDGGGRRVRAFRGGSAQAGTRRSRPTSFTPSICPPIAAPIIASSPAPSPPPPWRAGHRFTRACASKASCCKAIALPASGCMTASSLRPTSSSMRRAPGRAISAASKRIRSAPIRCAGRCSVSRG